MPDSLMYGIAVLLLLSAAAVMFSNAHRREPSHRGTLAAAAITLLSFLLFSLSHSYWYAAAALGITALFTGLGIGQYMAARRQSDEKSSQDTAPPQ
ncbi:hypothetical protein AB0G86_18655 [Streptomyces scabiei]|uniref:hypothetical protein n=1 Tax=Streptomyces scabiei TaxID=1930 RepID=UPI0033FEB6EA